ncbi:MAG: redoxin domain-containing protein [Candidatus Acidiferrum sp.]
MKKTLLIIGTVVALIVVTIFADRATRVKAKTGATVMKADASDKPKADLSEPDLTLKDLDDKNVSLAELKGKVVLVNFWATWCEPCRGEIPELIQLQHTYGPRGFVLLGIALDEEGKSVVAPFVAKERFAVDGQKLPMDYKILIGNDEAADKFGGLFGYPTSVLISRDGKQVKRVTGAISVDDIAKEIESLL